MQTSVASSPTSPVTEGSYREADSAGGDKGGAFCAHLSGPLARRRAVLLRAQKGVRTRRMCASARNRRSRSDRHPGPAPETGETRFLRGASDPPSQSPSAFRSSIVRQRRSSRSNPGFDTSTPANENIPLPFRCAVLTSWWHFTVFPHGQELSGREASPRKRAMPKAPLLSVAVAAPSATVCLSVGPAARSGRSTPSHRLPLSPATAMHASFGYL